MGKIAHTWLMVLVVAFHYSILISSAVVSTRNLKQFHNMIIYKGYSFFDYNDYGCWCGMGSHGSLTLDDTDECCRIHDKCYKRIDGGLFGCWPKLVTYDWEKRSNRGIVCTDRIDTCDRNACDCDKAAADCFERHRSTHDSALLTLDDSTKSAICNL